MKQLDYFVKSIYFVDGRIGYVKISWKLLIIGSLALPIFIIWVLWKGL